jgi:diguanylate cyclase (GGDEF)-like protein
MLNRIRDTDMLARMGGDEFAIVLNTCPDDMAERIAMDIRDGIGGHHFECNGQAFQLGASIGVVHVPPHWSTLDECLAAADAACYKAKQNGRASMVVHHNNEGS